MRRKVKNKNYDIGQEKLARGHASTRKLNIPSKHTADTNLWGVPLLETTTRHQHTQPLIDRYDCMGKKRAIKRPLFAFSIIKGGFTFSCRHFALLFSRENKILSLSLFCLVLYHISNYLQLAIIVYYYYILSKMNI